jgi:hypothetical protein
MHILFVEIFREFQSGFTDILGYSGVCFEYYQNTTIILVVFCAEYVGINYARYSEEEYCRNTIVK